MMVQSQSFLRYFLPFLILQFLSSNQVLASLGPSSGKSAADVQQRIIGYYPGFNHNESCGMEFDKIPAENFTHLNFAFGYINNSTFEIEPKEGYDAQLFSNFTSIRSRNKDVKLMISLAQLSGNSTSVFSSIVASSCNRQKFIERLICFMNRYCFDGVDFDWEFPGDPATGGNNSDRDNYVLLVKELRSTLAQIPNKDFVISFTAPTPTYYLGMYNLTEMMKYADFINFMAYDVVNANWGTDKHIYAHTNLTEINKSLAYLLDNGVPSKQINLGLAFYGNSYQLSDTSVSSVHFTSPLQVDTDPAKVCRTRMSIPGPRQSRLMLRSRRAHLQRYHGCHPGGRTCATMGYRGRRQIHSLGQRPMVEWHFRRLMQRFG